MRYKEAYLKAKKEDIILVDSPVGMPGRAIRNAFIERVKIKTGKNHSLLRSALKAVRGKTFLIALQKHWYMQRWEIQNMRCFYFAEKTLGKCSKIEEVREIMKEFSGNNT